ncbi:glycine--tRNA ligase subunit beta [Streptococcus cuniculipharyngis]|uniref:Glycine--tRNA ligase beta subunit n=1 Tax=Streptococcus cuniculipharyngis TaxID=1562651 RepID=A0A5C5SC50_9STRE|nr:glycine--tRNA ligase subunit beta [Streptococcus cuniculipharyngis]TWS98129.1 glycine--tRNA ligase subunit beta [Streptococcus cuniculipharyngis]
MVKNLLVELGLEELPAYVVTPSMEQLRDRMANFLQEHRLEFQEIETFSTPRRLAVCVRGLADQQTDLTEDFKGPAKKIALDADGNFTKAAEGFVRGKGLTTADIRFEEIKGEEYVYVTKQESGKPVKEVLANLAPVLTGMTFPVSMRWASNKASYIRPVHTVTVLLDDDLLDLELFGVQSNRLSRGHRFLGHDVEIASADSYEADLASVFVVANPTQRQQMIVEQIKALEEKHGIQVEIDPDLLNEVLNLVEYPTAFLGQFDAKYLEVPEEVLITSMKNHQRYFVVRDQAGQLLPAFVSVHNGNDQHLENVIKGNQKVLLARLEDAEFFWREDQKLEITDLVTKLEHVTFHEKIGSLADHMKRTKEIALYLAQQLDLSASDLADLERAATIYKFDLLTGMVGEFDELQGVMGEKYARLAGESSGVATAIREHYLPSSSEGALPESQVGAILAFADKLDTLLSFFSVSLIPSGSNDPYALRRAAQGLVRILEERAWPLDLKDLLAQVYDLASLAYNNQAEVLTFIQARLDKMLADDQMAKDIRTAVLASTTWQVPQLLATAKWLTKQAQTEGYKVAVENLARVFNLAEKAETRTVDDSLFDNLAESKFYQAISRLDLTQSLPASLDQLFALSPVIADFFDNTMVMVDDQAVKNNRLALLASLADQAGQFAIFNQLQTK